jgi:hypothetical protein
MGGALAVWLGSPTAGGHAIFGRAVSVAVGGIGLALTLVGGATVAIYRRGSRRLRWLLGLPMAAAAGAIGTLAAGTFIVPEDGTYAGVGILLLMGTAGMVVVAIQVIRAGTRTSEELRPRDRGVPEQ